MTKVVFENATIADVIRKADRVAPSTGQAFDKAAGIVIDVTPGSETPIVVRSTNLDIYSMEWVDALEIEGEAASWRLPSKLFAQLVGSLPISSGKTVTLEEKFTAGGYGQIHLESGRTRAKFSMMGTEYYPQWGAFDPDKLTGVSDVGGRISQVEWAAASKEVPYSGINLDGEYALATDRYRMARAPLSIPGLEEPITIPAGIIGQLLKQTGEIQIGVDGDQLLIMPDDYSQLRCILFGVKYPTLGKVLSRTFPQQIKLRKTPLLEVMKRVSNFAGSDRYPTLQMFLGKEEIAVMMSNDEVGRAADVIEVPGYCNHTRVEIKFTPKNIIDPIEQAPNEEINVEYDPDNAMAPVRIDGGSGYEAWIMPRKDMPTEE